MISERFALLLGVLLTKDWIFLFFFEKNTSNLETPKSYKFQMSFFRVNLMIQVFFRTKTCLNLFTFRFSQKVKRRLARLQMMRTRSQLEVGGLRETET